MILFVTDKSENPESSSVQPLKEEPVPEAEEPKNEETPSPKPYYDVVNVSEGFQLRTAYKKKVKPSKLDGLLERRVKQFTLEEKQRLERLRLAATKPNSAVKTEGATAGKRQPSVTPSVKAEENEGNLHVKDHVVKKLNFEQEAKPDVKPEPAITNHSKEAEGNGGEAAAYKEVNGGPAAGSELSRRNNCVSEATETKDKPQKPEVAQGGENTKKRGYDEMEQGGGQSNAGDMELDQSNTSPVQVNGQTPAPNIDPDQTGWVQCEAQKDSVKSLVNGNVSQSEGTDMCCPPPLKVPKVENHVVEEGECGRRSEDMAVDPPPSNPPCTNSNNVDSCSSSVACHSSSTDSRDVPVSGSSTKHEAASTTSSSSSTAQPGSTLPRAAVSQESKPPASSGSKPTNSMTISKDYSTRGRVSLLRFSKSKKARSGTALPSYRKFVTKSSKKSIFVLPNDDLKRLARRAGFREVPIFNYTAKPAQDIWPYPSPRPTFGITWRLVTQSGHIVLYTGIWNHVFCVFRYRLQTVRSLAGVSLMLRLLWACLRWDDMAVKPSAAVGTTRKGERASRSSLTWRLNHANMLHLIQRNHRH